MPSRAELGLPDTEREDDSGAVSESGGDSARVYVPFTGDNEASDTGNTRGAQAFNASGAGSATNRATGSPGRPEKTRRPRATRPARSEEVRALDFSGASISLKHYYLLPLICRVVLILIMILNYPSILGLLWIQQGGRCSTEAAQAVCFRTQHRW